MTEEVKKPRQVKKILIKPVHGSMHHLIEDYPIVALMEVPKIDGWLQAQIDAGKIEIV